jgi:hypothetical protein
LLTLEGKRQQKLRKGDLMRPSLDIDTDLLVPPSQRSGTGRHTLPDTPGALLDVGDRISLGGVADEFFTAGEAGSYEGGPARLDEAEPTDDFEPATTTVAPRSPEQDARRARLVPVVTGVVACFAALLAVGVLRAGEPGGDDGRAESPEHGQSAVGLQTAAPRAGSPANPAVGRGAAPAPESVQAPGAPAARAASSPSPAAATHGASRRDARAATGARAVARQPVHRADAIAAPPRSASGAWSSLPSVGNFAARSGDPRRTATGVPTASFAPAR